MPCLPSPSHHHEFIGGMVPPFPVMGGKNGIVLPTLYWFVSSPIIKPARGFERSQTAQVCTQPDFSEAAID